MVRNYAQVSYTDSFSPRIMSFCMWLPLHVTKQDIVNILRGINQPSKRYISCHVHNVVKLNGGIETWTHDPSLFCGFSN